MRYEHRKQFTALLSMMSVMVAVSATVFSLVMKDGLGDQTVPYTFAVGALLAGVAAYTSIMISQRLKREREGMRVFLIYAREDVDAARKLEQVLRESGFNPWLDVDQIMPGQVWQKAVLRALEESAVALFLISKHTEKKGFVQKELEVALQVLQEREKDISPVIPVRLDNTQVPEQLSHVHWVSLSEEGGIEKLVAGLKKLTR